MDADAAEEDGFAVEEYVAAAGADGAEADGFADFARAAADGELVEFRVFRTPEFHVRGGETEAGLAFGVGLELVFSAKAGDGEFHGFAAGGPGDGDRAGDGAGFLGVELDAVLGDEGFRRVDEGDAAGEAAVVPPIGVESGHGVLGAAVVHADDERVGAGFERLGDLEGERGEAADVGAEFFPVQIDVGPVVRGSEAQETAAGFWRVIDFPPVPDAAFVVKKPGLLRVPVAGHLQGGGFGEIVFHAFRGIGGGGVQEDRFGAAWIRVLVALVPAVVIEAGVVGIYDGLPVAIEGLAGVEEKIRDVFGAGAGGKHGGAERQKQRCFHGINVSSRWRRA